MTTRIRLRRDTAANWTSANSVLLDSEPGYETDTGKVKIGDGSTTWANLQYFDDRLNQAITANLIPLTGNLYTVGNATGQWDTAWVKTLHINNSTFTVIGNVDNSTANLTINGANVALEAYVVNLNSAMSARVNAANAAIITANTALKNYTDDRFTALINGAPAVMDTLLEISASLGNSASFSTTMVNWMANTNANIIAANAATVLANVNMKNYVDDRATVLTGNLEFVDVTISPKTGAANKVFIETSAYSWQFAANGATIVPGSILATDASVITSEGDVNLTAADDINIVSLGQNVTVSANDGIEINAGDKILPVAAPGGNVSIGAGNGGSNPANSDGGIGGTVTIEGGAGGIVVSGLAITAATQTNPVQIITTAPHGSPERVVISSAAGMTGINGSWYTTVANTTTLNLYYDSIHSSSLNGNSFPAYTGSGTLTARRRGGDIILSPGAATSGSLPGTIVMNGPVQFQDGTRQTTAIPIAPYYVDDTARDAAIPSPTAGMMVLSGTAFQGYNGSAWVSLS